MKIQCNCGAKYAFDVTPELAANPIKLVCPTCGLDLSDYINQLVLKELAETSPAPSKPAPLRVQIPTPPAAPVSIPAASEIGNQGVPPPSSSTPRLRINTEQESKTEAAPANFDTGPKRCLKHGGLEFVERCFVCGRPICPKCMEEFGYLCSPLCKAKAESKGLDVPVYAGQKNRVQARYWRKVALASTGIALIVLALLGAWTWYSWVGSVPHVKYSVKFSNSAFGESAMPEKNQLIVLHDRTLARHDLKTKKELWSRPITDKLSSDDTDDDSWFGGLLGNNPRLRVRGHNIWVEFPNKLVRYDWDSGKPVQEILSKAQYGDILARGDEVELFGFEPKKYSITRVNLVTGDSHVEEVNAVATPELTFTQNGRDVKVAGVSSKTASALNSAGKGYDATAIEQQVQSLPLPARIALPAVLAVSLEQQRALNEIGSDENGYARSAAPDLVVKEQILFVPAGKSQEQVRIKLLEKNIIERSAMKAPPKKSALDGEVNRAATTAVANEFFNESARDNGLDKVYENESRYQIILHRLDSTNAPDWRGQLIGPPSLFPLETVNVVAANKTLLVFDKQNKLLWGTTNSFNMVGDRAVLDPDDATIGLGPVVERNGTLYVADQGVLSAFDIANGNARWRLPTVGVVGILFDDAGNLYVNTTTANPESIKYSRQIDITRKVEPVVMKIDPVTGKTLWSIKPRSFVAYASGKFLYTIQLNEGSDLPGIAGVVGGAAFATHTTFGIRRLNPKNGDIIWQYFQQRAPSDVKFDQNVISLVFPKEVQVLRYLTF